MWKVGWTIIESGSLNQTAAGLTILSTLKGPTNCGARFLHSTRRVRSLCCPGSDPLLRMVARRRNSVLVSLQPRFERCRRDARTFRQILRHRRRCDWTEGTAGQPRGGTPAERSEPTAGPLDGWPRAQSGCSLELHREQWPIVEPPAPAPPLWGPYRPHRLDKGPARGSGKSDRFGQDSTHPCVRGVHLHHKLSSWIWVTENRRGGQQYLKLCEGGFSFLCPGEPTECGSKPGQRLCHPTLVSNKALVKIGEAQELLELLP